MKKVGILSCPIVRAKSGKEFSASLSLTSPLVVGSRIDGAGNSYGLGWHVLLFLFRLIDQSVKANYFREICQDPVPFLTTNY